MPYFMAFFNIPARPVVFFSLVLFSYTLSAQSIFTSTVNATGETSKISQSSPRFPGYYFEWSVGESSIITTNSAVGFQVSHGLLQGFLLADPVVPNVGTWFPDEIKIYPNPVLTDFTIELLTSVKGIVEFGLVDMKGALVYRRSVNYQGIGQTEHFNIGHLPSGSYLLRVGIKGFPETGGFTLKQGAFKIIKVR